VLEAFQLVVDVPHHGGYAAQAARQLEKSGYQPAIDWAIEVLRTPRLIMWSNHAAILVGRVRAERATSALVLAAKTYGAANGCNQTRHEAIVALARIGTPEAVEVLVELAVDWANRTGTRHCVECAVFLSLGLSRLGTEPALEAVHAMTGATTLPGTRSRPEGFYAIARTGDARFIPFFIELTAGAHVDAGLAGLQRVATRRAVPALLRILTTEPDRRTRRRAVRALATVGEPVRWEIEQCVGRPRHPDVEVRRSIAWLHGRVSVRRASTGRGDMRIAAWLMSDPNDLVRARAAESLGLVGEPATRPEVLKALGDPSYRVRACAATALGRMPHAESVKPLWRLATTDSVKCVRDAASAALRKCKAAEGTA
jgi:HEAT repeat protein